MERTTNVPVVAKKICNFVHVMFFMLRKGISKRRLIMVDLNMMMKRGKIAGKAMHNLMFSHRHHDHRLSYPKSQQEYEFSCSNTPSFPLNLLTHRKRRHHHHHQNSHFFSCAHAPQTTEDDMDVMTVSSVEKVFDMLNREALSPEVRDRVYSELSSPALERSPVVRQLRVTDSPFPLRDVEVDSHVDEAADDFISKFYSGLRKENKLALL